jgi:hypothetical protein
VAHDGQRKDDEARQRRIILFNRGSEVGKQVKKERDNGAENIIGTHKKIRENTEIT